MSDISVSFKRKISNGQYNFKENEFSLTLPTTIFGIKSSVIVDTVNKLISDETDDDKKDKKKNKKDKDGVKLDSTAVIGLLATIGLTAITGTGRK